MDEYQATIGIETHVQLKTKTKLFSAVANDARNARPNTLISHIDVGMPGALPVVNQKALELAAKAAFALDTKPQKFSKFDRKHYFYPDLPKGYQITQYEQPIILGGHVEINIGGQAKKIGITRVHLEEDAGKNIHPEGADYSLVDLNRAGTPLIEIVSQPDMHSAAEAKAYVRELYLLMKYADVSDVDLFHGNMRFDVNVSVSKDPKKPGIRAEVKNLNSFRSVEAAIEYEIKRQVDLLKAGKKVTQETRGWNEAAQKTTSQRSKEEAEDYRYMPEPDIPPIVFSDDQLRDIEVSIGILPKTLRQKLSTMQVDAKVVEDIIDQPDIALAILQILETVGPEDARRIAFWLLAADLPADKRYRGGGFGLDFDHLIQLSKMVDGGELSSSAAKTVFDEMVKNDAPPSEIAQQLNLLQVSDESAIEEIVRTVIKENPKAVADIRAGEGKAIGFLVGQVMQKSKGQANPGMAQKIIKKQISEQ